MQAWSLLCMLLKAHNFVQQGWLLFVSFNYSLATSMTNWVIELSFYFTQLEKASKFIFRLVFRNTSYLRNACSCSWCQHIHSNMIAHLHFWSKFLHSSRGSDHRDRRNGLHETKRRKKPTTNQQLLIESVFFFLIYMYNSAHLSLCIMAFRRLKKKRKVS